MLSECEYNTKQLALRCPDCWRHQRLLVEGRCPECTEQEPERRSTTQCLLCDKCDRCVV